MDFSLQINENEPIRPLVAGLKIDVQEYIKEVRRDYLLMSCMITPTGREPLLGLVQTREFRTKVFRVRLQLSREGE